MHTRRGHDMAVLEINEAGGIKALGGAKLELVYADSRGDPKIGMSEAERLIVQEKVIAIMGAYQSAVTYPSTEVAEKYKIPYLVSSAVKDEITERGFKYVFRLAAKASWWARDQMKAMVDIGTAAGDPAKTVAFVYENTDWGQSTVKGFYKYIEDNKLDVKVVLDEPYPAGAADLTPVVLKIKAAKPDALLAVSYTSDAILLINTLAEQQVDLKAHIGSGAGHVDPEMIKACGKNAEGILSVTEFAGDINRPGLKEVMEKYRKLYNEPFPEPAANAYAIVYVLADALERAASTDPTKLRDALAATKLTTGPAMIVPFDTIEFDENGQSIHSAMVIVQWQNGELKTVGPAGVAPPENKPIWPMVPWAQRK